MKYFTLALLLSLLPAVFADVPGATISGTLTDTTGGVLAGTSIRARNVDTGVTSSTTSNAVGIYRIIGLAAGSYEIEASRPQFTTVQRRDIVLRVGDEVRVDITMQTGEARESVVVKETTPLTQMETAAVSSVVNEQAIQELPSDGRQLQNLALIIPGVSAGWNVSTAANRYGKARENTEGAFTVNGARSRSNNFLLDGMPINVQQYNVINFEPSNEAVSQFAVLSELPPAEFGRTMGGQVNIITRSGSNRFHGSTYEFLRNNVLNANTTFNNSAGLPRGAVRHNQFGGTIGGPIWKQKHFFFGNVEFLRNLEGSETRNSWVPTPDQKRGLIGYTDASGRPATLDLTSRVTPISAKLFELYPAPNASLTNANYIATLAIALNDYQYHIRTDHHLTERDVVTVRTSWNLNDQVYIVDRFGGPYIPGFPLPNPERTTNGTLGYLHTFSPAIVNQARIGVNRYGNDLANGDPRNSAEFGVPNGSSANGIPTITFTAGGLADLGGLTWYNRIQNETTVFASDVVSIVRGAHAIKIGGDFTRHHYNTRGAGNQRGTISFDGSRNTLLPKTPANSLANVLTDLALGLPYQASITTGQFGRGYRQSTFAVFVQDSWRANHKLTLEYGVRYDYSRPYSEVNNKLANFFPGRGLLTPASSGWEGLYRPDRNNFAPRFGFAYDLFGKNRTVVRGGFGMLYETHLQASTVQQIENNAPFSASGTTNVPTPFPSGSGPATTLLDLRSSVAPSRSIAAVPLGLRNPYSMQYSFDIQHALTDSWVTEAAYRATRGAHLPVNFNMNQVPLDSLTAAQRGQIAAAISSPAGTAPVINSLRPFPDFANINLFANEAGSIYHALQLKIERRFRSGLNLIGGYTWAKSIDDASDFGSGDASERVLNSFNRRLQRAVSSFDIPSRFTLAFNFAIPAPMWKPVLGGWKLNGNITAQSGQPFTPFTSRFDPYTGDSFNRLNVIGDPKQNVPAGFAYNPAAFALPAVGTFGNSGRNIIRGDGFRTADLSLLRDVRITESMRLQLRLEAANALNQVNFQGPVVNQASTPGAFISTAMPRTVQLGAKFSF